MSALPLSDGCCQRIGTHGREEEASTGALLLIHCFVLLIKILFKPVNFLSI